MKITINNTQTLLQDGQTVYDALRTEGAVSRDIIAATVGGSTVSLTHPLAEGDVVAPLTFADEEGRCVFWHTAAHVLAHAVKNLYPTAKLAIGPAVEGGFYYDFDMDTPIDTAALAKIEKEMQSIIKQNLQLERVEYSREQALRQAETAGESYKVELIARIPAGEAITFYKQGDFADLCAGPHLFATGALKAVKLLSATGAYWGGSSDNKMLTRIYGTAYPTKEQLAEHLEALEEAKKRDHNKLGRELGYFTTVDYIGQGLPVLLPKGAKVVQILQRFVEDEEERRGYQLTKTPSFGKRETYKISSHWDKYRDGMFVIGDPEDETSSEVFALRPMTCPFQFPVYTHKMRSYRDLPVRLNETATLFRNEHSGEMHGLIRLRQFTLSDGHIICTPEQLEAEFVGAIQLVEFMMKAIGLHEMVTYRFSKWDKDNPEKYLGDPAEWERVQDLMREILDRTGLAYAEADGEAAFYGPKLDVQAKNVYGKEDTLFTIQI
ncbi:MAG: threonine--tRNA ligase, partial [Oscillospiraceae bacterium]|nr:threonine--tRNA ligase [Oscillospiraceae bacterium]